MCPHPHPWGSRVKPSFNGYNNRSKMVLHVPLNLLLKLFTYYYYYFLKNTSRGTLTKMKTFSSLVIFTVTNTSIHIYIKKYFLHKIRHRENYILIRIDAKTDTKS